MIRRSAVGRLGDQQRPESDHAKALLRGWEEEEYARLVGRKPPLEAKLKLLRPRSVKLALEAKADRVDQLVASLDAVLLLEPADDGRVQLGKAVSEFRVCRCCWW